MLFAAIAGPLLAAILVATQQRHEDRSADSLASVLAWLLAGLGLVLLANDFAAVSLQLGTLFGTATQLEFSLVPNAIGLGMAAVTLLLGQWRFIWEVIRNSVVLCMLVFLLCRLLWPGRFWPVT